MHARDRTSWLMGWLLGCAAACGPRQSAHVPSPVPSTVTETTAPSAEPPKEAASAPTPGTFADDVAFLQAHTPVVVLHSEDGAARVAIAPEYQGRVMTSTAAGDAGPSFGWIHRPIVASEARQPHMTVLGGEDRFWLGPEGGQFGLYFAPGAPFDFEHWQVPEAIDWGPFSVVGQSGREIAFERSLHLINHAGTEFDIAVHRSVRVLDASELGLPSLAGAKVVGYETENVVTNTGKSAWTKETGLLSIWILGMFTPSDGTTVVLPIRVGNDNELGPAVRDDYFGKVPPDRLRVRQGHVFFRGDGKQRGKIGIPRTRALPSAGSYDSLHGVLTLVQFTLPEQARDYVDSRWQTQAAPYAGDVSNSYNDGPPAPGDPPLGPFYEIESSSPAVALGAGQTLRHTHRTVHVMGTRATLDACAQRALGVSLDDIEHAFDQPHE